MIKTKGFSTKLGNGRLIKGDIILTAGLVLLTGENGSGKSTLLRSLVGYHRFRGYLYLDDQKYRGSFFNRLYSVRKKAIYLSPIKKMEFCGLCFNDILTKLSPNDEFIAVQKILCLPLTTRYELLSSGEISSFHLLYALLLNKEILLLDELLSSLSVAKSESLIEYFAQNHGSRTIVICSQKELQSEKFDVQMKILGRRIICSEMPSTISSPKIASTSPSRVRFKAPRDRLSIAVNAISSLIVITSTAISLGPRLQARYDPNNYRYAKVSSIYTSAEPADVLTPLRINEHKVYFVGSDINAFSPESINIFSGSSWNDRYDKAQKFMKDYFAIEMEAIKRREDFDLSEPYIQLDQKNIEIIRSKTIFNGFYLSADLSLLATDHYRVDLMNSYQTIEEVLAKEKDAIVIEGVSTSLRVYFGGFEKFGSYVINSIPDRPSTAFISKDNLERYQRERRYFDNQGTSALVDCLSKKYVGPKSSLDWRWSLLPLVLNLSLSLFPLFHSRKSLEFFHDLCLGHRPYRTVLRQEARNLFPALLLIALLDIGILGYWSLAGTYSFFFLLNIPIFFIFWFLSAIIRVFRDLKQLLNLR